MAASRWDRLALRVAGTEAASIPVFLYGTAWKKDRTADLVYQALCNGFTAIDTAGQPKHYREDLVGEGIRRAISEGKVKRENIFIQTKYTSIGGQDPDNMPYNPASSITEQVHASIKSSLRNLRPLDDPSSKDKTYLDALVLHSPLPTMEQTLEAWAACEEYVPDKIRHLGISNCTLPVLSALHRTARVKPAVVQNRFYRDTHFDGPVRQYCRENSIIYQSFWTLTANPDLVYSEPVGVLAQQVGISPQAALYCFVLGLGNTVILNGTKNEGRMVADLQAPKKVERFSTEQPEVWEKLQKGFGALIGESGG
ncbi:aldo-keto reductase, putative [Coccidioides posadasii C735 delta SOWgp]|uniref:Aldo-keto reductase, putative n=1 Tax=Coccidioides posadasii (strain C735) TaxID=222929 RepID=C5P816_COCP7|nr:aldo-keto reductase, putative [Coccidioides posadasii C735 delta SOWgp]EER27566.1 aldo-keto reductase, putative [Coccidioides posadasii C735 delta SOWgp]|eukprot:XP_003069711.1 aldo-keto reductase, putative [Coccidioides posadasii C735 delta SOWgp]